MNDRENLLMIDHTFWKDRRVLLTGHTGFKGSWLAQWLKQLGADVYGFALAPESNPNLHDILNSNEGMTSTIGDLCDLSAIQACVKKAKPEVVIHMAAQAFVRRSYDDPVQTFSSNIMGTVNLFEALRDSPNLKSVLVITSDKVYENDNSGRLFEEQDPLGGSDPYSASKGCQDIITHSYRRSFFEAKGVRVATARAGNVVGGGDWSEDRLLKDVEAAVHANEPVIIRNPLATRPWQHVLEPLSGYLKFAQELTHDTVSPNALNFGPPTSATVEAVVDMYLKGRGATSGWQLDQGANPEEAHALAIDISLAKQSINWVPRLDLDTTILWVAEWFNAHTNNQNMIELTNKQIKNYETIINGTK